jgi:hypothetical protein
MSRRRAAAEAESEAMIEEIETRWNGSRGPAGRKKNGEGMLCVPLSTNSLVCRLVEADVGGLTVMEQGETTLVKLDDCYSDQQWSGNVDEYLTSSSDASLRTNVWVRLLCFSLLPQPQDRNGNQAKISPWRHIDSWCRGSGASKTSTF